MKSDASTPQRSGQSGFRIGDWSRCAAVGGVALAAATSADADVMYTPLNITLSVNQGWAVRSVRLPARSTLDRLRPWAVHSLG